MPHRIYFWRVKDRNGRWYQTRFRATEEHIRTEHPEAERIEQDAITISDVELAQAYVCPFHLQPKRSSAGMTEKRTGWFPATTQVSA